MDTVHYKADECQTSILRQLHRNRMSSKMAIKMFTILNGYGYNILFLCCYLKWSHLLNKLDKSLSIYFKNIQKQRCPLDSRNLGQPLLSFSSSTFTSFTVLPIIGCAVPRSQAHLKSGSWSKEVLNATVFLVYPAQATVTENCIATYPCLTDTEKILSRFL